MSVDIRSSDRRRYMNELQAREKEIAAGLVKVGQPASPKALQENEKRIRREIANSNERRRMQCINAGFSSLRALIPQLEGEKLSKAAILQHTTEYISSLEKDKARLQMQLDHSKRLLAELGQDRMVTDAYVSNSPPPSKRKKRDTESSDEGVGSLSDASDDCSSDLRQENVSLRHQLEAERQRCVNLEERNHLLEAQLLSVLQVQATHPSSHVDRHTVGVEHRPLPPQESLYNREVVEVIASRDTHVSSPPVEMFQPPRPLSPTPERGMAMEISGPIDATTTSRSLPMDSCHYSSPQQDTMSPALKLDINLARETGTPVMRPQRTPSSEGVPAASTPSTIPTSTDQHNYHHHHNYCHRDHPRRRHRQQAQLEQQRAEEEMRRQQEQTDMSVTVAAPAVYRPKHNTQNLENLVEAIRHIEGDRVLCDERKLYEEEHKLYDKRQSLPNMEESERETSSVSDQDDLKSESSGRDSPLQHPRHHLHHHHHEIQQQSVINSHPVNTSSLSSPLSTTTSISSSSSFSDKYPIASHLLHRPLHSSFYRPGVIVHKQ